MAWELFGINMIQVLEIVVALAAAYVAGKLAAKSLGKVFEKTPFPENIETAIVKLSRYVIYAVGLFVIIALLGFDLMSLVVGLGAFSIAISFATSTLIQNLVSGLLVQADRAFCVGDRIAVKGIEGEVVKISVRTTVVETEKGDLVYIPNSLFLSNPVTRRALKADSTMRGRSADKRP
jgi:potassium efflux system protein